VLLAQAVGLPLCYLIAQQQQKHRMKELMEKSSGLEKIIISYNEYKGAIVEDELNINGELYDIKSAKFAGDKVELLVINDSKEKLLLDGLERPATTPSPETNSSAKLLQQFFSLAYMPVFTAEARWTSAYTKCVFSSSKPQVLFRSTEILTPPPELT
jgi:hypothetical protein